MSPSSVRRPGGAATAAAAATCARVPPAARTLGVSPTPLPTTPSSRIINAGCSGGSTRWPKVQRCPGDIVKVRKQKKKEKKRTEREGGVEGAVACGAQQNMPSPVCITRTVTLNRAPRRIKQRLIFILWGEVGPDSRLHYASVAAP